MKESVRDKRAALFSDSWSHVRPMADGFTLWCHCQVNDRQNERFAGKWTLRCDQPVR
jgi:hypothetical protein